MLALQLKGVSQRGIQRQQQLVPGLYWVHLIPPPLTLKVFGFLDQMVSSGQYETLAGTDYLQPWQGFWLQLAALPAGTEVTVHFPKPVVE